MISNTAIIDSLAIIKSNVTVGNFSIIGPNVEIGSNTYIGSHVLIKGYTKIGSENKIFQFSSIGEDSQHLRDSDKKTKLIIGNRNIFREGCTIHRGTKYGSGVTIIGNDNLFMVSSHIAHDSVVENNTIFANNAAISGHVSVGSYVTLGGKVGVHQFCNIGSYSFLAGGSIVFKDVLPYSLISGYPAKFYGLNNVGLKRNNFHTKDILKLKKIYKLIFNSSLTMSDIILKLNNFFYNCKYAKLILNYLKKSKRGIIR